MRAFTIVWVRRYDAVFIFNKIVHDNEILLIYFNIILLLCDLKPRQDIEKF